MSWMRTKEGAIKETQNMLIDLKNSLKMAWSKNNPKEFEEITKLQIVELERELKSVGRL